MSKEKNQKEIHRNSCIRCGTCCLKGGPTLHHEDKKILLGGHIGYQHLITVRRGELAFDPVRNKLEPVRQELVKVLGKGKDWSCYFYAEERSSCTIYEHRLLECRLLKCWAPSELINVIGKNTIIRADIINPTDPIMEVIETHERECPCHEIENLISNLSQETDKSKTLAKLNELVRKDLSIRFYAISELELKREFELFIFGRPFFKILDTRGIPVSMAYGEPGRYSPEMESFISTTFKIF
jgi:Fe-S-cluster containining protein